MWEKLNIFSWTKKKPDVKPVQREVSVTLTNGDRRETIHRSPSGTQLATSLSTKHGLDDDNSSDASTSLNFGFKNGSPRRHSSFTFSREPLDLPMWSNVTSPGFTSRLVQQASGNSPLKEFNDSLSYSPFRKSPYRDLGLGELPFVNFSRGPSSPVFPSPQRTPSIRSGVSSSVYNRDRRRNARQGQTFVRIAPIDPSVKANLSITRKSSSPPIGMGGNGSPYPARGSPRVAGNESYRPEGLGGIPQQELAMRFSRLCPSSPGGPVPGPGRPSSPTSPSNIMEALAVGRKRGREQDTYYPPNATPPSVSPPSKISIGIGDTPVRSQVSKRVKFLGGQESHDNRPMMVEYSVVGGDNEPLSSESILEQMNQTEKRFLPDSTSTPYPIQKRSMRMPSSDDQSTLHSALRKRRSQTSLSAVDDEPRGEKIGRFCTCNECYAEAAGTTVSTPNQSPRKNGLTSTRDSDEKSTNTGIESQAKNTCDKGVSTTEFDRGAYFRDLFRKADSKKSEKNEDIDEILPFGKTVVTKEMYEKDKRKRIERYYRILKMKPPGGSIFDPCPESGSVTTTDSPASSSANTFGSNIHSSNAQSLITSSPSFGTPSSVQSQIATTTSTASIAISSTFGSPGSSPTTTTTAGSFRTTLVASGTSPTTTATPSNPGFSFGGSVSTSQSNEGVKSGFGLGGGTSVSSSALSNTSTSTTTPGFSFGGSTATTGSMTVAPTTSAPSNTGFAFGGAGSSSQSNTTTNPGFSFGGSNPTSQSSSATSAGFAFGGTPTTTTPSTVASQTNPGPGFSSTGASSTATTTTQAKPGFSFGGTTTASLPILSSSTFGSSVSSPTTTATTGSSGIAGLASGTSTTTAASVNPGFSFGGSASTTQSSGMKTGFGFGGVTSVTQSSTSTTTTPGFSFGGSSTTSSTTSAPTNPGFSFGGAASASQSSATTNPGFSFGGTNPTLQSNAPSSTFAFGGTTATTSTPSTITTHTNPGFSFGGTSSIAKTTAQANPSFSFGGTTSTPLSVTSSIFGSPITTTTAGSAATAAVTSVTSPATTAASVNPGFSFGGSASTSQTSAGIKTGFGFGAGTSSAQSNTSGSTTPGFSFGGSTTPATTTSAPTNPGFSFGGSTSTSQGNTATNPGFSFGGSNPTSQSSAPNPGFAFGGASSASQSNTATNPGFSFGGSNPASQSSSAPSSGFAFGGTPTTSAPNTVASQVNPGFSFGGTSSTAQPTAQANSGFSFGGATATPQTNAPSSTGFAFGGAASPPQNAPATGGFSFGGAAASPPSSTPASTQFAFGGTPQAAATPFQFGQQAAQGVQGGFNFAAAAPTAGQPMFSMGSASTAPRRRDVRRRHR